MSQSIESGDNQAALEKLTTLIDEIQFAMLTTVEADGSLRSRPMATHRNPGEVLDGVLWFFTKSDAPKPMKFVRISTSTSAMRRPTRANTSR